MNTTKFCLWKLGSDPARPWERRCEDSRGVLTQLVSGETFRHLGIVQCPVVSDAFRGRHAHRFKHEEFFVLSGTLVFYWRDLETGAHGQLELVPGDRLTLRPGLAHSFKACTEAVFVEFCPCPYDPTDVYPFDPLQPPEGWQPDPDFLKATS